MLDCEAVRIGVGRACASVAKGLLSSWALAWAVSIICSGPCLVGVVDYGPGGYHADGPATITELERLPFGWNRAVISGGKTRYVKTADLNGLSVGDSTNMCDGYYRRVDTVAVLCDLPSFWRLPPYVDAMLSGEDMVVIVDME